MPAWCSSSVLCLSVHDAFSSHLDPPDALTCAFFLKEKFYSVFLFRHVLDETLALCHIIQKILYLYFVVALKEFFVFVSFRFMVRFVRQKLGGDCVCF